MGRNWEKLAGETGREVPSGRLERMVKVGKLGVTLGAGAAARRMSKLFRKKDETQDAAFLTQQAQKVTQVLGQMKGATMKVGQILSSDPDLVPPEFAEALESLQASAPPMTFLQVREQLEGALDRPLESVFSYFDPEPIGSASIGQVHRGTLSTGERVAVKVQYPGIEATLDSDIKNLGSVMQFSRVMIEKQRIDAYLEEVRNAILQEADYLAEAENLRHFHEALAPRDGVTTPRPYLQWTRKTVLTMELMEGEKMDAALDKLPHGAERTKILHRLVDTYSWMLHDRKELHADPHPGNFLLTEDGQLVILDWGCVKKCDAHFSNGILDIMDACWQRDDDRAAQIYRELGFGKASSDPRIFDPSLLREYHEMSLEPFLRDEEFDFGSWELSKRLQSFVFKNPAFLKLHPPAEGLLVFRVLGGIKGFLNRTNARLNVHQMAVECARRNGRLTGQPMTF